MRSLLVLLVAVTMTCGFVSTAVADDVQAREITVRGSSLADGFGREVVLRGFDVSGEAKLAENGFLPFANAADARKSAQAMRSLTGANAVRFPLSWAGAEPVRGQLDAGYLTALTDQLKAFLDEGVTVLPDYHQDLYSRYLFSADSWYSGDGAPKWVVAAGNYAHESCGICVHWGQNITQNSVVQNATSDFWHNAHGVQDEFFSQATETMNHLRTHLSAAEFAGIAGMDPYNEPYAGRYDSSQDSRSWEQNVLWSFFQRFRQAMDTAGWPDKPAFVEPNMFWNANISFEKQTGGLLDVGAAGSRYVFNTHFYDQLAQSGVLMPGKAGDGQYAGDFGAVRDRAAALGTAAIVTEFGPPMTGFTSDKTPTVDKAMYQALDSRLSGATWWTHASVSGPVLSGMQWQWDIYSGQHHELMNDNPQKVLTTGDGWNGEDYSAAVTEAGRTMQLRQDARLLDRLYPAAVAGHTLAFTYEDRLRDGSQTLTWNQVPSTMPAVANLVGTGRYGVLVWQGADLAAPTELHIPADLSATVVTDLDPAAISRSGDRLRLAATPGLHYALIAEPSTPPTGAQLAAARTELATWVPTVLAGSPR
ncbi:MAG: endoglycosylceramidase [Amycolatopsis sp.]|uniref:endoglycosylceramidase n=1 Tax=Amycolatopsis sp. TaxID=37632 RepID=UPI0026359876|nr:endoglycosylceramidase [Amycolatopsis sp.]MCU1686963.1 endoglycosylceramidase [Amycolatopsis sp.]